MGSDLGSNDGSSDNTSSDGFTNTWTTSSAATSGHSDLWDEFRSEVDSTSGEVHSSKLNLFIDLTSNLNWLQEHIDWDTGLTDELGADHHVLVTHLDEDLSHWVNNNVFHVVEATPLWVSSTTLTDIIPPGLPADSNLDEGGHAFEHWALVVVEVGLDGVHLQHTLLQGWVNDDLLSDNGLLDHWLWVDDGGLWVVLAFELDATGWHSVHEEFDPLFEAGSDSDLAHWDLGGTEHFTADHHVLVADDDLDHVVHVDDLEVELDTHPGWVFATAFADWGSLLTAVDLDGDVR